MVDAWQRKHGMTWIESHLGVAVVRYRWWIISTMVPLLGLAASGMRYLEISNDTRVFFDEHNPDYRALLSLEHTYSKEQGVFFVLAPKGGTVFTRDVLAATVELTEAAWQIPYSIRVHSLTNFQSVRTQGDDLVVRSLVDDPNDLSEARVEQIRQTALAESALRYRLLSPSGHVAGMFVGLVMPSENPGAVPEVARYTRRLAQEFRARHPEIELHLTGSVIMDDAFAQASRQDMGRLTPVAFVVMTTLVALALRSWYGTFAAVSITLISMLAALGLVGWLGVPLNAVTIGAPGLMLTLSVADNVHVLTTLFRLIRQGRSKPQAVAEALQTNAKAIFLTNITTILGFVSLNFSESPPWRDMGNMVALGVSVDLINSVLLLPALMAVLPLSVGAVREKVEWMDLERLADFAVRRHRVLLGLMLVLVAVTSLGLLRIELDDNFLTYFDDTFEFRRATDFMARHLTGWDIIEYSLPSGESGGIADPNYLALVDRFAAWYRQQPEVVYVATFADTMKRFHRDLHEGDPNYYRIPEQRDLAAQYLLLYELSLPFGQDLNSHLDVDKSAARFTVILRSLSANELCAVDARAAAWLAANAPPRMHLRGTGLSLIWARITQRNIRDMLWASFLEILFISGLMIFSIRNVKFTVIFLIPNLVPPFIAFGIWGLTKGRVGLALSVVVAMTLGIIVDDTIHFFVKYFAARREHGMDPEQAVRYAFGTVVAAIGVTTLVLIAGFLVLMLSHYRMSSEMGLMCAMVIALALSCDFFLTPALLMKFDRPADRLRGG